MTRRKQEQPSIEQPQSGLDEHASQVEQPESNLEARIAALETQLSETQAKAQEYLDALQRERADFVNYRRRVEQEKEQMTQWMTGETIKKLLPVLDDLELALANRPAGEPWANGVELVYRKFQSILEREGVTRIEAEGKPFDPNLHEAIMQEASETHDPGVVTAVLRQGYLHGERVLRPALVKVAQ
ncbi:MAG: nucleotide exchange factor GrpE [Anaerolineales bacterium]|nr:nucleotide exchange factor GrpE [Anaerolineales bacterium]MCX7756512.1 nucleotide exchange factor GrpE [Anaerolineales bacterium]MDW8276662.1 nucleotide exchange factor GrpE [Anaerolineales bacterium]